MSDRQQQVLREFLIRTALIITSTALTKNGFVACKPIPKTSRTVYRELIYLQAHLENGFIRDMLKLYERYNWKFLESRHLTKKTFSMVRNLEETKSLVKLLTKIDLFLKKHALHLDQLRNYTVQSENADVPDLMIRREQIMARLEIFLNLAIEECDDAMWPEVIGIKRYKSLVKVSARGGVGLMIETDLNFIKSLKYFLITAIDRLQQHL